MLVVGELTIERARQALAGRKADIVYSDPPWGPGNLMYWRTHNKETTRTSWPAFLETFCRVVAKSIRRDAHVMVEMGTRWVDELSDEMAKNGIKESCRWNCLYGNPKLPNVLWYSGPGCSTNPSGLSGVSMTKTALSGVATSGALVLDPCCGKGMTARCSLRLGMQFAGVELNPRRAEVTRKWLDDFAGSRTR
jgi:hypothetical protein